MTWEAPMFGTRISTVFGAAALGAGLLMAVGSAVAHDESKYPDFTGQWRRAGQVGGGLRGLAFDPAKPFGLGQKPPLIPEYQAIYEASLKDMEQGGQGIDPTITCLSPGMPRVMMPYQGLKIALTAETTYILFSRDWDFHRQIHTDGRGFPDNMALYPRYLGYSIGKW